MKSTKYASHRHFVPGEVAKWPTAPDCKSGLFEFARSNRAFSTFKYITTTELLRLTLDTPATYPHEAEYQVESQVD